MGSPKRSKALIHGNGLPYTPCEAQNSTQTPNPAKTRYVVNITEA